MLGTVAQQPVNDIFLALANNNAVELLQIIANIAEIAPDFSDILQQILRMLHRVTLKQTIPEFVDNSFDDEIITEDVEISTRLLANGYKTRYAANAVVFTEGPSDWESLCSQRLRWKFGRLQTYAKHSTLFFNPSKSYNPYLTFLILPVALYVELILLLEPILLTVFYAYTILANDYWPLALMISFSATIIWMQILCDSKPNFHRNLILLAPVAWIVFYVVDLVEFQALCRSINRLAKKQNLEWQSWTRVGIISRTVARTVDHSNIVFLRDKVS
jgi:hypothetical protein